MIKKTIESFFKKMNFETQSNVETPLSQAHASHSKSSNCIEFFQIECHETKTRIVEPKM